MKKFPERIPIPKEVTYARKERIRKLMSSSFKGVGIRLFISAVELLAVLLVGSSALFMDALATAVDIAFSLFLVLSFKLAEKPPDKNHPFGHGRFEPLAGLQLGLFLVILGAGMAVYQLSGAVRPEERVVNPYLWFIPLMSIILLEATYQFVMRTAKKQNSPALEADAWHYRVDGLTSLFAMIALIFAAIFPAYSDTIDHLGALLISIMMIGLGVVASKSNLNQLLDRVPENKFFQMVEKAALRVKGVLGTEKIRIQMYGPDSHIDIDIEVDPHLTVEEAHKISQETRVEIQKEWPAVRDVTVHIEPYYPNDH